LQTAQTELARAVARLRPRRENLQSWGTFLRNHAPHIAALDLFVVPTIGFNLLYVLVIVRLARRELVWINVTAPDGRMDRAAAQTKALITGHEPPLIRGRRGKS